MKVKDRVVIKGDKTKTLYEIRAIEVRSESNPDSNHYDLVAVKDGGKVKAHHSRLIPAVSKGRSH